MLFDLEADGTIDYRALDIIASAIGEKMDKYRGKSVEIKIGWSEWYEIYKQR